MASSFATPSVTAGVEDAALLRQRIADLLRNPAFNCARRPALVEQWPALNHDALAIVFLDLDDLNGANFRYGYEGVNARVRAAFDALRSELSSQLHSLTQWQEGDEFVLVVPKQLAQSSARRLQDYLNSQGLSATFGIVAAGTDLELCIGEAEQLIKGARGGPRGQGQRGVVVGDAGG
jgi:GGDEF domain-containing protein